MVNEMNRSKFNQKNLKKWLKKMYWMKTAQERRHSIH